MYKKKIASIVRYYKEKKNLKPEHQFTENNSFYYNLKFVRDLINFCYILQLRPEKQEIKKIIL